MPAERSGIRPGDGSPEGQRKSAGSGTEFPSLVEKSQGARSDLEIRRGDRTFHLEVRPQQMGVKNGVTQWQIGVGLQVGEWLTGGCHSRGDCRSAAMNTLMARQSPSSWSNCFVATFAQAAEDPSASTGIRRAARQGASELLKLMAMIA